MVLRCIPTRHLRVGSSSEMRPYVPYVPPPAPCRVPSPGPAGARRHGEGHPREQGHLQPHRHRGAQEKEVPQAHHHDDPGAPAAGGGPPHRSPGRRRALPAPALQHHRQAAILIMILLMFICVLYLSYAPIQLKVLGHSQKMHRILTGNN